MGEVSTHTHTHAIHTHVLLRHRLCLCWEQIKVSFYSSLVSNRAGTVIPECSSDIRGGYFDWTVLMTVCVCVCVIVRAFYRGQTRRDWDNCGPGHAHPGDFPMGCHHQHHCRRTGMWFTQTHRSVIVCIVVLRPDLRPNTTQPVAGQSWQTHTCIRRRFAEDVGVVFNTCVCKPVLCSQTRIFLPIWCSTFQNFPRHSTFL